MKYITIVFICVSLGLSAQESKFNLSVGGGLFITESGIDDFLLNLEPKFQVSEVTRVGFSSRIGFDSFKSFLVDLNVKPSKKGQFYLGLGFGRGSYEFELTPLNFGTSYARSITEKSSFQIIAPRIGIQGKVDVSTTAYFIGGNDGFFSLDMSYVIGYKKSG